MWCLYLAFREKILGNCSWKSEVSQKILLSQSLQGSANCKWKSLQKSRKTRFKAKTKRRTSHPCGKTPVCEIGNRHSPNRCWATSCGPVAGRDWTRSSPLSWFARWTGCGWRATCCTWSPGSASTTCPSSDSRRCEWQGLRWRLKKLI